MTSESADALRICKVTNLKCKFYYESDMRQWMCHAFEGPAEPAAELNYDFAEIDGVRLRDVQ